MPIFNLGEGPFHEGTTQNPLTMLPMGRGYSIGSLGYHGQNDGCIIAQGCKRPLFLPFLDRLTFHCVLIFQPHSTVRAVYILTYGSTATTTNLSLSQIGVLVACPCTENVKPNRREKPS